MFSFVFVFSCVANVVCVVFCFSFVVFRLVAVFCDFNVFRYLCFCIYQGQWGDGVTKNV